MFCWNGSQEKATELAWATDWQWPYFLNCTCSLTHSDRYLDWETDYELTVAKDITKACFWACVGGIVQRHSSGGKWTKTLPSLWTVPSKPGGTRGRRNPVTTESTHCLPQGDFFCHTCCCPHDALPFFRSTVESIISPQGFPFVNSCREERFRNWTRESYKVL